MEVIIKGTKEEIKELLAEIRRKDKEYITVPYYQPITPRPSWEYTITCGTNGSGTVMKGGTE